MVTVLVVDDDPIERMALVKALQDVPHVRAVTTSAKLAAGHDLIKGHPPDIVLVSVDSPDSSRDEAVYRFITEHPDIVVIATTNGTRPVAAGRAVAHGARGYIAKDASVAEIVSVIGLACAGSRQAPPTPGGPGSSSPSLSERELQVLQGMARGLSNVAIGRELYLSEDTIKTHARRLYRKLRAPDRSAAVAQGFRSGLLR